MRLKLPKIYPITDVRISGISHSEQVLRLTDGGACFVQLREKHTPPAGWLADAVESIRIAHASGAIVLINDRVDIAMALGADGVHLGQDDLPPAEARKLLGDDATIGFSTHSLEQAAKAVRLPIDYIAFGPIFATGTKENPGPVVGLDQLARVRNNVGDFPIVAIGGINDENLRSVLDAGADSVAIIGAVVREPDHIAQRFSELHRIANNSV